MVDAIHEEKTARQLDRLSEALDSGKQVQVGTLLKNLSAAEIADLLESLPLAKRLAVWEMADIELEGDILVEVNDEVRASLIRHDTSSGGPGRGRGRPGSRRPGRHPTTICPTTVISPGPAQPGSARTASG